MPISLPISLIPYTTPTKPSLWLSTTTAPWFSSSSSPSRQSQNQTAIHTPTQPEMVELRGPRNESGPVSVSASGIGMGSGRKTRAGPGAGAGAEEGTEGGTRGLVQQRSGGTGTTRACEPEQEMMSFMMTRSSSSSPPTLISAGQKKTTAVDDATTIMGAMKTMRDDKKQEMVERDRVVKKMNQNQTKNWSGGCEIGGGAGVVRSPKVPKESDAVWLFDLRSARGAIPWHPNSWKVRLALNYKQIKYTTIWLTYPSMEPVMRQMGIKAARRDKNGKEHYTVPVIIDRRRVGGVDGEEAQAVVGSKNALEYLDAMFPDTPRVWAMFPDSSGSSSPSSSSPSNTTRPCLLQSMFDSMIERVLDPPFWKMIIPLAWMTKGGRPGVLDEDGKSYFLKIRDLEKEKKNSGAGGGWDPEKYVTGREWDALKEGFETIAAFCEMYGIGAEWSRAKSGRGTGTGAGRWTMTRVEIVLVAYLAALYECAPRERWVEVVGCWSGGMWGVLWEGSEVWRRGRD